MYLFGRDWKPKDLCILHAQTIVVCRSFHRQM